MTSAAVAGLVLAACATAPQSDATQWQPLFDGRSTTGWRNVGKQTLDPRWQVVDGALVLTQAGGGDIISDAQFADFELEFAWWLAPGGNSGMFYRATDADPVWQLAAEYQLLDDAAGEDRFVASHRSGAVYDLIAPAGAVLRSADDYNRSRVVACGSRVEHWLNGVRVAAYDSASKDWQSRLAASKFRQVHGFAVARRGHIAVQDHGAVLRLRNMRIRGLRACAQAPGDSASTTRIPSQTASTPSRTLAPT